MIIKIIFTFFIINIIYILFIKKKYVCKKKNLWFNNILIFKNYKNYILYFLKYNKSIFKLWYNKTYIPPVKFKKIIFYTKNSKFINSLIKDINSSFKSIFIILYIWEPCYLSNKVAISLIKASKRGIDCRIILDSFGSWNFFQSLWPLLMNKAGIKIVQYLKINIINFFFNRIDLRQHKKIFLIDDYITYLGSNNLIDSNNFKKYLNLGKWIDIMLKIKGKFLNKIIKIIFFYDWELVTGNNLFKKFYKNYNNFINCNIYKKKNIKNIIQIITSGPDLPNNLIHKSLLNIIYSSKKRIIISTPYFIPTKFLLKSLCIMSKKGIDISIILPYKNDCFFVYWANRFYIYKLLLSNIKVYFLKKNFLHTKAILIDDNISLIGTINFDMRSIWLNLEIGLIINDIIINKKLYNIQKKYISKSILLDINNWKKRSLYKKIFEKIFYLFNKFL